jgi:site-specific recombinase XerD
MTADVWRNTMPQSSSANRRAASRRKRQPRQRASVASYVSCALSANTKRAYRSDLAQFRAWGGQIPCSAHLLARYLADSADSLKVSTLSRQLAAIAHAHNAKALPSPCQTPLVKSTLRGIRRTQGCNQKQALPITPSMLRLITRPNKGFSKTQNVRDRALLLTGFAGGFRRSELASLVLGDVAFKREGVVLRLRGGKTDQFARGRDVAIPYANRSSQCAVTALKRWLELLKPTALLLASRSGSLPDVPLFTAIDRHGHVRGALHAASIGWILTRRMLAAGIESAGFSAHSLRAGLVTSAAKAGVPVWSIQRQTGHRSLRTVQRYIRNLGEFECNAVTDVL